MGRYFQNIFLHYFWPELWEWEALETGESFSSWGGQEDGPVHTTVQMGWGTWSSGCPFICCTTWRHPFPLSSTHWHWKTEGWDLWTFKNPLPVGNFWLQKETCPPDGRWAQRRVNNSSLCRADWRNLQTRAMSSRWIEKEGCGRHPSDRIQQWEDLAPAFALWRHMV